MSNVDDILGMREDHPSYGMLGFYRVTKGGRGTPLFGSSIKHRDTIRLVLKRGHTRRNLNQDWYYGDNTLFEVEMSYSQFAELICAMNVGDGIPVTIRKTMNDRYIPECPFVDRSELHISEFKEHLDETYADSQKLINKVAELFSTKNTFKKSEREEILSMLRQLSNNIGTNQKFQVSQFQEQMEHTVTESKGEIESFFQNKMLQIAQQALVEDPHKMIEGLKSPIEIEGDVIEE